MKINYQGIEKERLDKYLIQHLGVSRSQIKKIILDGQVSVNERPASVHHWLKPGDKIEQDESVLEVATDKVDTEVPSTHGGILKEILAQKGDVVKVGKAIAILLTEGNEEVGPVAPKEEPKSKPEVKSTPVVAVHTSNGAGVPVADYKSSTRFYSPLVKNIAKEENIDPVGSCVGQKGVRVTTVIAELGGEKIDIIPWSEDKERFISSAISPAKALEVEIDEDIKHAKVTVAEDQLSLAIGKGGQNVRLAVKLTGYKIDIRSRTGETVAEATSEGEVSGEGIAGE